MEIVREGNGPGYLPELEVSSQTLARDLDFLRDEERAPTEYDARPRLASYR